MPWPCSWWLAEPNNILKRTRTRTKTTRTRISSTKSKTRKGLAVGSPPRISSNHPTRQESKSTHLAASEATTTRISLQRRKRQNCGTCSYLIQQITVWSRSRSCGKSSTTSSLRGPPGPSVSSLMRSEMGAKRQLTPKALSPRSNGSLSSTQKLARLGSLGSTRRARRQQSSDFLNRRT